MDDIVKLWHIITQLRSSDPDDLVFRTALNLEFKKTEPYAVLLRRGLLTAHVTQFVRGESSF